MLSTQLIFSGVLCVSYKCVDIMEIVKIYIMAVLYKNNNIILLISLKKRKVL
jgi:hypothetical protein